MILALFGFAKTGKTFLFNILTGQHENISKFSLSGGEYHKAVIDVPDGRLQKVASLHGQREVHAKIEFLDTGPVAFAEAKDSTFLDLIRRADGLVHLVRAFSDAEIIHPLGNVEPKRDMRRMEEELVTTDFIALEKRIEKLTADVKKMKSKEMEEELVLLKRLAVFLEKGRPLREFAFSVREASLVRGYKFVSQKPLLHLVNADECAYNRVKALARAPQDRSATEVFAAKIESELLDLDPGIRLDFEKEYGIEGYRYIRDGFVRCAYDVMNLISFFTLGKDETRAWAIERGTNAFDAAGKIHTDIQHGFIRAEVIDWRDFVDCGGMAAAKEKGKVRLEGKEYLVQDGEVIHFRFSV